MVPPLRAVGQEPPEEGGFCTSCGTAKDALDRLIADRDRLALALDNAHAEITRLRDARPEPGSDHHPQGAAPFAPFVPVVSALPQGAVAAPSQGIDFGAVAKLSPEELDKLPYGLITLDGQGRIIHYNDTEARLVGLPKERVLGRSFFGDVAPCARVREFEGRFLELARDPLRVRVQSFDFVFRFARGEHHVSIVITPARLRGQFHMALIRRALLP